MQGRMMKGLLFLWMLLALGIGVGHAATRGDVKVIEASETIKYRINHLAKNYLLFYRFPAKKRLRQDLREDMAALGKGLETIALTTKDAKTRNLLAYFAHEKARINEILGLEPTRESLEEILQISEGFIEGADSIARHHAYDFAFEEKMYMRTRLLTQKLEEILKYYIASRTVRDDPEFVKKMERSAIQFEETLKPINEYEYTESEINRAKGRLNRIWRLTRRYLSKDSEADLPLVMDVAANRIELFLDELGIYHSKNQ
jgi:hypothetical protein